MRNLYLIIPKGSEGDIWGLKGEDEALLEWALDKAPRGTDYKSEIEVGIYILNIIRGPGDQKRALAALLQPRQDIRIYIHFGGGSGSIKVSPLQESVQKRFGQLGLGDMAGNNIERWRPFSTEGQPSMSWDNAINDTASLFRKKRPLKEDTITTLREQWQKTTEHFIIDSRNYLLNNYFSLYVDIKGLLECRTRKDVASAKYETEVISAQGKLLKSNKDDDNRCAWTNNPGPPIFEGSNLTDQFCQEFISWYTELGLVYEK